MKERSPQGKRAQVATTEAALDPQEEKVIRMRHGLGAPDEMPLPRVGQDRPDVAEQLRQMELRALKMSGRLEELQREAGVEPIEPKEGVKDKIIARLQDGQEHP